MNTSYPRQRFLRRPEVEQRTGLSKTSIYRGIQEGTFPQPLPLGPRTVVWPESAIVEWMEKKMADYDPDYGVASR